MRSSDWLVDMGPGAGEHGGHVVAEGPAAKVERNRKSVTGQFLSGAREIAVPGAAAGGQRLVHGARRVPAQPQGHRRRVPDRALRGGHRRLGLGQVDARERDRLQVAREPAPAGAREAGRARHGRGHRGVRQGDRDRPAADRPHAAVEPGDLHRPLHAHPRALLAHAGCEGARLQAGAVLVQRQGRPLRDLQGRRADQDRDALPARRLRPLRDLQGPALQPRDARGSVQGQDDRRHPRDVGRGGAPVLRQDPEDPPPAADPARRRARLHDARPAGDDALGRRGAAGQARRRALQGRDGAHALHPRRADDRPPFRRHREAARGAAAARRHRQHGARDRAQPRRDQAVRLDRRPRPRGRRGRRRGDRDRHARGRRCRRTRSYTGSFLRPLLERRAVAAA